MTETTSGLFLLLAAAILGLWLLGTTAVRVFSTISAHLAGM